ncbi:MAG: S-layer homology domain-containing protein [Lachnospiraceae bacterium]|jgi:hypothetical protein
MKFRRCKKVLSVALAIAMSMSMASVPVLADTEKTNHSYSKDTVKYEWETKEDGSFDKVKVTISCVDGDTSGDIVIAWDEEAEDYVAKIGDEVVQPVRSDESSPENVNPFLNINENAKKVEADCTNKGYVATTATVTLPSDEYNMSGLWIGKSPITATGTFEQSIEKKGHKPAEAVKEKEVEPTCDKEGSYESVVKCEVCGEVLSREDVTVPATGHDYKYDVEWDTETLGHYTLTTTCANCDYKDIKKDLVGELVEPVSCKDAYAYWIAVTPDEKEHSSKDDGVQIFRKAAEEHKEAEKPEQVVVKEATCSETGTYKEVYKCTKCGEVVRTVEEEDFILEKVDHTPGKAKIENQRVDGEGSLDKPCAPGTKIVADEVTYCTVCGEEVEKNEVVLEFKHTEEEIPAVAPECEKEGYTAGVKCSVCDTVITPPEKVEALEHDWVIDPDPEKKSEDPTCNKDTVQYYICTICGKTDEKHHDAVHDYSLILDMNSLVEPECGIDEETGDKFNTPGSIEYEYRCDYCNGYKEGSKKTYVGDTELSDANLEKALEAAELDLSAAAAHDYKVKDIDFSSAKTNGKATVKYECVNCGEAFEETETVESRIFEATCTEAKSIVYVVTLNDVEYSSAPTELKPGTLGHIEMEKVVENDVPATCTKSGSYDEVVYCERCGEELSRETIRVEAEGHTLELIPEVPATALKDGSTAGAKCTVCDEVVIVPEVIPATGFTFVDVNKDSYYAEAVDTLNAKGIMTGLDKTYFGVGNELTRGHFALMLYRQAGSPEVNGSASYPDVPKDGSEQAKAIKWCQDMGYITGYSNGTFGPHDSLTREQLVTILYRMAGEVEASADLSRFEDGASVSGFAKKAMQWAVANGVISGKNGKYIDPQGKALREEVATMLYRMGTVA